VILGQDPYHGAGQAHGLSFSVKDNISIPPSLKNIFKELNSDLNIDKPYSGNLTSWALEGVLLLNSSLTVESNKPNSHQNIGWKFFTDKVIEVLGNKKDMVYILWGKNAQLKKSLINTQENLIIESAHPSPFSADKGFFGSKPFSRTNDYLIDKGNGPINWKLV
jgi:uracil-DNA glycosylase